MKAHDYNHFAESELENFIIVQNEFKAEYNIDSFKHWIYDEELNILRLYNDDEHEIFFKYIPIGTFSLTKKTWMWSWFNNYVNEKNKTETLQIKRFGIEHDYEKLSEGTFQSDKFDGWEFLAISYKLLNGIGAYNIQMENLNYYLLLTEIISNNNPEIKIFKKQKIECKTHGFKRAAFVCQHLNLETAVGFEESFETYEGMELDDEDDFAAWCSECEKIRIKYEGWNDESEKFAQIKLVCENCYFEMKKLNNK